MSFHPRREYSGAAVQTARMFFHSRREECGIRIFSRQLASQLAQHGILLAECNVAHAQSINSLHQPIVIHYAPSMWALRGDLLEAVLETATDGRVLIILHGMYGPDELDYRADAWCPDLRRHLLAMDRAGARVLSLSNSCTARLALWEYSIGARAGTCLHPGLFAAPAHAAPPQPYVFFGGVIRPKKDPSSPRIRQLLEAVSSAGIRLWVHATNRDADSVDLPAWRRTFGMLDAATWATAIASAAVVLCPYDSRIQCVSGIIAEALSAGTPVLSTRFVFAEEMAMLSPEYVFLEDDLSRWPEIAIAVSLRERQASQRLSSWPRLGHALGMALCDVAPYA